MRILASAGPGYLSRHLKKSYPLYLAFSEFVHTMPKARESLAECLVGDPLLT